MPAVRGDASSPVFIVNEPLNTISPIGEGANAQQIQGTATDGEAAIGRPVQIAGKDDSNNAQAVRVDSSGNVYIFQAKGPTGAANIASGQVTASSSAQTLIAARATRREVSIVNTDLVNPIYIGPTTVTANNGHRIAGGGSISVDTTALIQVIAPLGSPVVTYLESYD